MIGQLVKRIRLTKGGIAGLIAVAALAGVGGFLIVARTINTAPSQCATCHPAVTAMWRTSLGHPSDQVTCHQCHAPHAELPKGLNVAVFVRDSAIPEKYRALTERMQERCEGCHDKIRETKEEQKKLIRINHQVHLTSGKLLSGDPLRMACLDCHRTIAHEVGPGATNRPKMRGCFAGSCHAEDRNEKNCRRCHYQQLVEANPELT